MSEIRQELRKFRREVGDNADLMIHLELGTGPLFSARLYPQGIGITKGDGILRAEADSLEDVLAKLRAIWDEASERVNRERVRAMALAIIRITAERGACTEADLRGACEFTHAEVERYGEDAIADANEIASNGPFSIVKLAGANAA